MSTGNKFKEPVITDTNADADVLEEAPKSGNTPRKEKKVKAEKLLKEKEEKPVEDYKSASKSVFRDDKFIRICGFVFLITSVFLLIPFVSYFFTHEADFDKVNQTSWFELFGNSDIQVENWLGKLGAIVAHVFIYKGFGIASCVLP